MTPERSKKAAKEAERAEITETFRNIAKEWHETRTDAFTEKHRTTVMYRLEKFVFPKPVKLGPRTTAWKAEDIHFPQASFTSGSSRENGSMAKRSIHQLFICIFPTSKDFPAAIASRISCSVSARVAG